MSQTYPYIFSRFAPDVGNPSTNVVPAICGTTSLASTVLSTLSKYLFIRLFPESFVYLNTIVTFWLGIFATKLPFAKSSSIIRLFTPSSIPIVYSGVEGAVLPCVTVNVEYENPVISFFFAALICCSASLVTVVVGAITFPAKSSCLTSNVNLCEGSTEYL